MRIVAISDTHHQHRRLTVPPGDVLVHAGDITRHGSLEDVRDFDEFLWNLPHRHKVVIAGNHDFCFQESPAAARALLTRAIYLQDETVLLDGVKFYGSPWQPWFHDWAFNLPRGAPLSEKWQKIPADTRVLITHGPPMGHGDRVHSGERVGCQDLLEAIRRIQPQLHIFGHIHEDPGITLEGITRCVNASSCDLRYLPTQAPIVIDL
jgi:Icc-related predicted phosphoesterase